MSWDIVKRILKVDFQLKILVGAKFWEYGTFLPAYQRSPVWPHPNTQPKDLNCSVPASPNDAPIEGGNQNSVSHSNASQPIRNGPTSFRVSRKSKSNNKLKQEVNASCGNKFESVSTFANHADEKSLTVQIKVGSDNMLTKRNAEIYNGLGLDVSPSSSLEANPVTKDWFFHGAQDGPDESPTSILEMMTSFPVSGSALLSPLPYDLLHLTKKKPDDNHCGPVHVGSQESIMGAVHGSNSVKVDQNVVGKKLMSTEKKETNVDSFGPGNKATSSGCKRKAEGGLKNESFTSKTKKNDNGSNSRTEDFKKNDGKLKETYKDFFGELDIEQEHNDEMALEKHLEGVNRNGTLDNNSLLKERLNGKKNQNLPASTTGNGLESDAAARTVVPVVHEDWVCCDICEKWRLLPPGEYPGGLPEKWICNMLDWLPGMNWCSVSEDETTKAITSRFPGPHVHGSQPVHPAGPHLGVISLEGTHQHSRLEDLTNEANGDRPSLSSSSSKKKLHSSHKARSLNGVSHSSLVNEVGFQDLGQSHDLIVEKVNLKQEENNKLCENFADEGNNIHHYKISNKSESAQDFPKNFKKEDCHGGPSHISKSDKRAVLRKRKKVKEYDGSPVELVSSSPMRILNIKGDNPLTKNVDIRPCEEKSKGGKHKSKELLNKKVRNNVVSTQDSKKHSKKGDSIKGKSNSSPPGGQSEIELQENAGKNKSLKGLKRNKKSQNQNGNQHLNIKNPTPERHKEQRQDSTVVLVRELSNQATTNALREATNLKHMADRVKNNGSNLESRALYMEAALKFLHVAYLFESCHSETGRYGDMIQSVSIYNSTAKLCKYCAHEYERTKEMTTTSLAYKCMEVAYLKVVYSSIATSCKDANELQTFLHIDPTGGSLSSSSDKATLAKGVNAPQVAGNHVITSINKPNFTRILNFTQNVNLAMEASMKSRIAFAACSSKEEAVVSAIKRALDFNFYDVEELLQQVRVAMELINR
ncbi:hypothetical protein SSX86_010483 [Deinandra increscens subsp. villosa]|uniref:CW-type domain-containing protein n=1 Tax=Deinandra increscens subsp. villosa TaxID=3103831 RepID=A0AAP0D828_9ASTR